MWSRSIFILFITAVSISIHAQQLIFQNISDQLNLPSKECYNIMQDSRGCIWMSTDAGLCMFNGNTTQKFDKQNGIPENSCYAVTEDKKGRIWIGTSNCRLLIFQNNEIKEAPLSKKISDSLYTRFQFIYTIKSINKNTLYIATQNYSFRVDLITGKIIPLINNSSSDDIFIQNLMSEPICIKNGEYSRSQIISNMQKKSISLKIEKKGIHITSKIPIRNGFSEKWRVLTATNKEGETYITYLNHFIRIDLLNHLQVYTIPNKIISIYIDKNNGLWVGTYKGGALYYSHPTTSNQPISILPDYSVSGILEDAEGGIWCSTLEKGIFYSRNKFVISYQNINGLNKKAEMLKNFENKIYFSSIHNKIIQLNKNGLVEKEFEIGKNLIARNITSINHKTYIIGREFIKTIDQEGKEKFLTVQGTSLPAGALQITEGPNNQIYILSGSRDLNKIVNEYLIPNWGPFWGKGICLFYSKNKNELFVGAKNGAYRVDPENLKLKKINSIEGTVLKIIEVNNGELCFLTKESGIYLMNNHEITRINKKLGIPASIFFDLTTDIYNHVWIASNMGLIKITNSTPPKVQVYNTSNGLPSNRVYYIAANDSNVFISTEEGLARFPIDQDLSNSIAPCISLLSFKIDDQDIPYQAGMTLPYHQNTISLAFFLPTYKEPASTAFIYELNGPETKTEKVKGYQLQLNKLPPGDYSVKVYATNHDGVKSKIPVLLNFTIKKPFWNTWWFVTSIFLILSLAIFVIIKAITRSVRLREEKKTKIHQQLSEYRLNALQAQMNPHFIFNAINSIQHYILSNKTQAAYDYLAKFSKLIRLVLSNSQHNTISLKKEFNTLELYLELEQQRFKNKFVFNIEIEDDIDIEEIKIPVMLVQPFVENAIWHGMMNLPQDKKGQLSITALLKNELLKITIEDNGIGREKSKKIQTETGHISMGTMLSEERITLLNEISNTHQKVIITDLFNEQNEPIGTKVEIFLANI